ncbi:hypothetical protein F4802DRAFT_474372 [Xylaria palmicola]|nr:hypothetical protein F4802DRAFT_474372 [Xylaria palmicola]
MELHITLSKEVSRIPGKPERPYISSLKSCSMETRRRPIRTYSKRAQSTESTEPAPKRQCIINSSSSPVRDQDKRVISSESKDITTTSISQSLPSLPPTKKGTITAYFQRIPQPSAIASSEISSDAPPESDGPTTTPPSSPPISVPRKRRVRRLTTRVVSQPIDEKEDIDEEQESPRDRERRGSVGQVEPLENASPVLSETSSSTLNQDKIISGVQLDDDDDAPREERRRGKKQAQVQTTLSLSMSETQYTECKECGMLYNHLHKTDVNHHARRHAALRRARAKAGVDSDVAE